MDSTELVELYVYDMSKGLAKAATSTIFAGGVEAVFHTGVFVFDREYSYGTKGIKESPPLSLRPYSDHPHKIEKIGKTSKSLRELNDFVRELGKNTFRSRLSVGDQEQLNMGSTEVVELYIYDMSKGLAKALTIGSVEAVFHTGVFVFGREYSYGTKGIKESPPPSERPISDHPHKIEKIGKTSRCFQELENFVRKLAISTFRASDYHVLRNNCNIFSQVLCNFLCAASVPKYILNLQETTSERIRTFMYKSFVKPVIPNCFGGPPEGRLLSTSSSRSVLCSISTSSPSPNSTCLEQKKMSEQEK